MIVTDVKQQLRRKHRYSIFIDGKYSFSLSATDVIDEKLVKDKELSASEMRRLQVLSRMGVSYDKLLRFLSIRLRSRKEIEEYLDRKSVPIPEQSILMAKLEKVHLIDDKRFAEAWINRRRKTTRASGKRISYELRMKGVEAPTISRLIANNDIDEITSLKELVLKKRRLSRYKDDQKLMRYLVGQGYSYADVKAVLSKPES